MNTTLKLGGGAAVTCVPAALFPLFRQCLAGTGMAAIGGAAFAWEIGLIALAVPAAGGVYYFLSRRKATAVPNARFQQLMPAARTEGCGCGPSCSSSAEEEAPIACTLDAGDFKERTASIRDLARRSLRHALAHPLTLTLTYEPERARWSAVSSCQGADLLCLSRLRSEKQRKQRAGDNYGAYVGR